MPNRLGLAAVFLLIAAAAGCTHEAPRAAAPSPRASGHASASTLPAGPATFPGPDGVEARWVVQENDRPGTTAWAGAGVLDTGTNNWIPALHGRAGCHPGGICESAMVQRVTGNILRLFGQGPAARHQPSVPNWRQVAGQ